MKILLAMICMILAGSLWVATDADAARLGGGRSFGMQRNITPPPRTPTQAAPAPAQPATAAPGARSSMGRWLGPIAGLAAGLGLAALFSHLGLGENFATLAMVLLLIAGAVFLFRMWRRPAQGARLGYAGGPPQPDLAQAYTGTPASSGTSAPAVAIPAGFDSEGFLRQAKVNFVRLQAANDAGNVEDIRDFTTPEVFAEIRLDMQDRGSAPQQTDIVVHNADLLDVSEEGTRYVASVRFHGSIREQAGSAPLPFEEIWNLTKPRDGSHGWQVAGIQQVG
jgi:predicted lipid-binding transport protein (Tim44 family)